MPSSPASAAPGELCFPETGRCISGRFREYWEQNGGLAVFGYPTSQAAQERNRDTGQTYLTQWFERNRFELHPENKAPYDVLLGRLGDDALRGRGIDWQKEGRAQPKSGCLYFEQTGHNVCDQAAGTGFKSYWQTHGLEFDGRRGVSYGESLALFGLPLTEPRMETNSSSDNVMTQWFERARVEWHPNQSNPAFRVLLGLLGNELRGAITPTALPTNVSWVRSGSQLIAVTHNLPTTILPENPNGGPTNVVVAPNGNRLAYSEAVLRNSTKGQRHVILDLDTGKRREIALATGDIVYGGVFSPDSQQFAYTVISGYVGASYEFRVIDLTTDNNRVIVKGANEPVLVPQNWNSGGVFARRIVYASDAPPQGLYQVDLQAGTVQTVAAGSNYGAYPNPDGRKAALVTGTLSIGSPARTMLQVLDRTTGNSITIVPMRDQFIGYVKWTPDGNKLVHARVVNNGGEPSSIHVTNADGSGEQVLRLEGGAFPGRLYDLAWRNNSSLLLLTADGPGKASVFEVSLSNFHPASAKKLATFNADGTFFDSFAYVPR
jgi:WD40 repeat protein